MTGFRLIIWRLCANEGIISRKKKSVKQLNEIFRVVGQRNVKADNRHKKKHNIQHKVINKKTNQTK
jgi:hypothetical protein